MFIQIILYWYRENLQWDESDLPPCFRDLIQSDTLSDIKPPFRKTFSLTLQTWLIRLESNQFLSSWFLKPRTSAFFPFHNQVLFVCNEKILRPTSSHNQITIQEKLQGSACFLPVIGQLSAMDIITKLCCDWSKDNQKIGTFCYIVVVQLHECATERNQMSKASELFDDCFETFD